MPKKHKHACVATVTVVVAAAAAACVRFTLRSKRLMPEAKNGNWLCVFTHVWSCVCYCGLCVYTCSMHRRKTHKFLSLYTKECLHKLDTYKSRVIKKTCSCVYTQTVSTYICARSFARSLAFTYTNKQTLNRLPVYFVISLLTQLHAMGKEMYTTSTLKQCEGSVLLLLLLL